MLRADFCHYQAFIVVIGVPIVEVSIYVEDSIVFEAVSIVVETISIVVEGVLIDFMGVVSTVVVPIVKFVAKSCLYQFRSISMILHKVLIRIATMARLSPKRTAESRSPLIS